MKEAPGFITGNELIDPGTFVLLHCFFYEYDFRFGHCISIQNFIQLVCLDQIFLPEPAYSEGDKTEVEF